MRWTHAIKDKFTASALLLAVLGIVLYNNIDRSNQSAKLNKLITSIYEDRLMVENFIHDMSENMHQIIAISKDDTRSDKSKLAQIRSLISETNKINEAYSATFLTKEEQLRFNEFTGLCNRLALYSSRFDFIACEKTANESLSLLDALSDIQLEEGKSIIDQTDMLFSSGKFTSQFEVALLIIIGLLLQALIFSSRELSAKSTKQFHLN